MKYDEFVNRLKEYKAEYRRANGKDLKTIEDLEKFLEHKKYGRGSSGGLKSLKGLGF